MDVGFSDGSRRRKTIYGTTRSEVATKLREAQTDKDRGRLPLTGRQRVGDFLDDWLLMKAKPGVRPKTYERYEQVVRIHLKPTIGHLQLQQLRVQHVQELISSLTAQSYAQATVENVCRVLRTALNVAVDWDLVRDNVARRARPPKHDPLQPNSFTLDETRQILTAAASDARYGVAISLALLVGFRRGEILGLRWSDLRTDESGTYATVRSTVNAIKGGVQFGEPKSHAARRTVALPGQAVQLLETHRARQAAERLSAGETWADNGLICATSLGTPINPRNLNRAFATLVESLGFPHRRFHDCRHTAASLMLTCGVPTLIVHKQLGHSDARTTFNIYGHVKQEDRALAASMMTRLIAAPETLAVNLAVNEREIA